MSWFLGFGCLGFLLSKFIGSNDSWFQSLKVSWFQRLENPLMFFKDVVPHYQVTIACCLIDFIRRVVGVFGDHISESFQHMISHTFYISKILFDENVVDFPWII